MTVKLFSYGTLQQRGVQLATFGRVLDGRPDTLAGFALSTVAIADPGVIAASGSAEHPIIRATGNAADRVTGTVLELTEAELLAADGYEVDAYRRVAVRLESGTEAFAYVSA